MRLCVDASVAPSDLMASETMSRDDAMRLLCLRARDLLDRRVPFVDWPPKLLDVIVRRGSLASPPAMAQDKRKVHAARMWRSGLSRARIGSHFGVDERQVQNWLQELQH